MKISVIIPTFNRATMACECVAAVLASDFQDFEVIVVDDCSTDDTRARISERFLGDVRVRYHRNQKNKQLGGSRNVGATLARGKYLLFLDDDNLVEPDMLKNLVSEFEVSPEVGIVAPMAVNEGGKKDGRIWTLGSNFNPWTSQPRDFGCNLALSELPRDRIRFPTLYSPNAFAVARSLHEAIGGFCERLPFYYDESDYGWRISEMGRESWILSTAVTRHQNFRQAGELPQLRDLGINTPWRAYLLGRNRLRFSRRHFSFLQILSVTFVFAPLSVAYYGLVALRNHRLDIAWAYAKGTLIGMVTP